MQWPAGKIDSIKSYLLMQFSSIESLSPQGPRPRQIYHRSLWYYNLVNSPYTMINADDLENWTKGQWGLESSGMDWVNFHRDYGRDATSSRTVRSIQKMAPRRR